jgi:hypothetical protein
MFHSIVLFYLLSILLIGLNGEPCLYSGLRSLTCSSFSPQFPGITQISPVRVQQHLLSLSFSDNLAPVRYILF